MQKHSIQFRTKNLKKQSASTSEPAVNLLRSFLDERSQCFKIGTKVSQQIFVNHGVPPGTVLGPLTFLLYVNDFSEKIKGDFELVQFAYHNNILDENSILCRYEPRETIATKIENILLKTDSYLNENQLNLNADKTELLYFSTRDELEPKVTFNGNLIKSAESCRYLGIHLDSKMTFEAHLIVILKKMAAAIRSLYLVRNHLPLEVRLQVLKSLVLSHLSFSGVYLQTLSAKYIQRINRQINWGIKVCYMRRKFDHIRDILLKSHVLPAELIISKLSILKLHTDLNQRIVSETFKKCANRLQLKQNKQTKQLIIRTQKYTKQSKRYLISKSIKKWNKLPSNARATETKILFKRKLTEFLQRQHENFSIDRQKGSFVY